MRSHMCAFLVPLLLPLLLVHGQSDAATTNFDVRASGPCSKYFLARRGIDTSVFSSAVQFNRESVRIEPRRPTIPGCLQFVAEGVRITRTLRHLSAEVELRISGTPDPSKPLIPCGGNMTERACPCDGLNNPCLFCGFCKNVNRQQVQEVVISRSSKYRHKSNVSLAGGNSCDCDAVTPGLYDIRAKICTPDAAELAQHIPYEMNEAVSLFVSVYMYDFPISDVGGHTSSIDRQTFLRRRARGTVGCYLIGADVTVDNVQQLGFGIG